MPSNAISILALPYVRRELPGWGRVMRRAGIFDEQRWRGAAMRTIRGKMHGYELQLDLANWSERQTYFLGRFYELETQLAVSALLRDGDWMIDVGANIGMITLLAAHCVGPGGKVLSFEPHPGAFARLAAHISVNRLEQVTAHQMGLSDEPGTLRLSTLTEHTGMSTFAPIDSAQQEFVTSFHDVPVARGDDVLIEPLTKMPSNASLLIKIDVEGFEVRVLRGLRETLHRHRPAVITEFAPDHLRRAGFEPAQLLDLMREQGYRALRLGTRRARLRHRLWLTPFDGTTSREADAANLLWLHESDQVHLSRVHQWIAPADRLIR